MSYALVGERVLIPKELDGNTFFELQLKRFRAIRLSLLFESQANGCRSAQFVNWLFEFLAGSLFVCGAMSLM